VIRDFCLYLDSNLHDRVIRIELLEMLGLKGFLGLLPLFMIVLALLVIVITRMRDRRGHGQRRPGVDYLWDKVVEEPPVPAEIPDWVRQLAPPKMGRE
jgi:hypothetical protein